MGYWSTNPEGHSFAESNNDPDMIWGDAPADYMDNCLKNIIIVFKEDVGRAPTAEEIIAGVKFSLPRNGESLEDWFSDI